MGDDSEGSKMHRPYPPMAHADERARGADRDEDDEYIVSDPVRSPWTYKPGESLYSLTPEAMCQGPCLTDEDVYGHLYQPTVDTVRDQAIRSYFGEKHRHLAEVRKRYRHFEHADQAFVVYRDILIEIEVAARAQARLALGTPSKHIDIRGLWKRARSFNWDWEHRAWMHLCSDCQTKPSFAETGPFGGQDVLGVDVNRIFTAVIGDRNPAPKWYESALQQIIEAFVLISLTWPTGPEGMALSRGLPAKGAFESIAVRSGLTVEEVMPGVFRTTREGVPGMVIFDRAGYRALTPSGSGMRVIAEGTWAPAATSPAGLSTAAKALPASGAASTSSGVVQAYRGQGRPLISVDDAGNVAIARPVGRRRTGVAVHIGFDEARGRMWIQED